jgi:hypothetical protein
MKSRIYTCFSCNIFAQDLGDSVYILLPWDHKCLGYFLKYDYVYGYVLFIIYFLRLKHVTNVKVLENLMPVVAEFIFMVASFIVSKPYREDRGQYFMSVAIRCVLYCHHDFRTAVWSTSVRWVTTVSVLLFVLLTNKLLLGLLDLII